MRNSLAVVALFAVAVGSAAAPEGLFSKAQTERGARVYSEKCASCHGEQLEGGDHAPSLKDDAFWEEWGGKTVRSLYSRIISTMPPTDPGGVPEKDVIDVVAYLVHASGAPEGSKSIEHADELNSMKLAPPAAQ